MTLSVIAVKGFNGVTTDRNVSSHSTITGILLLVSLGADTLFFHFRRLPGYHVISYGGGSPSFNPLTIHLGINYAKQSHNCQCILRTYIIV